MVAIGELRAIVYPHSIRLEGVCNESIYIPVAINISKRHVDTRVKTTEHLPTVDKAVVVTHGWIDKAEKDWPARLTNTIAQKVDPNEWLCASFDWRKGSVSLNPVEAARYARDIAGPRLAAALKALPNKFKHVHIIGHSAGVWAANSAAKKITKNFPHTQIHLTFLDAYTLPTWNQQQLGLIDSCAPHWAEHYYTKDLTFNVTQTNLTNAHNVNITAADPWFKEHNFPYRWYSATVSGKYRKMAEKNVELVDTLDGTEYGFARSLEAGTDNFNQSLKLNTGNKALKLKKTGKTKKPSKCPLFGSSTKK